MRRSAAVAAAMVAGGARAAQAHAFGERYDLPLPLELYLAGAAAAVAFSFVVAGLFVRDAAWLRSYPRVDLLRHPLGRLVAHPAVVLAFQLAAVILFALVIAAGLFGSQDPLRNLAPVLVWIVWWVGMAIVSAFVGDLWSVVNPWRTIFAGAEALRRRARGGRPLTLGLPYPDALGVWPAVVLLLAFTWSELVSPRPALPAYIAWMAIAYSLLTWGGMALFGREQWLRRAEVFSVLFALLARFSPMEIRLAGTPPADRALAIRPFAVGLLREAAVPASLVAFVLLYLVGVIYDGLLVTPAWGWLEARLAPLAPIAVRTFGLLALWGLAAGLYLLTCRAMAAVLAGAARPDGLARRFVLTLVPIAIAYHLAHYLTYLLVQGQYAIPLASDPFGRGWDLLGTAGYRPDIAVVGARFAWYMAIVAIVAGHIIAVFLAHWRAVELFGAARRAVISQGPMTALMVLLTVTSLTILAEPIVQAAPAASADRPGAVAIPADALLPEPGSGRLLPVGAGRTAASRLSYGAMASPFHDGTAMTAADLLYPFAMAYRWGASAQAAGAAPDPAIATATALVRRSLLGLKFAGTDPTSRTIRFGDLVYARARLMVDVYLAVPADDVGAAAVLAPPWSPLPWHVVALMEEAVARGWAAFSAAQAARLGVEWLDPVRSEPLKERLAALVAELARDGHVPAALAGLVTPDEARARWKALAAFHAEHGHFLVTNGPYRIKSWADGVAVLDVVRDPRYPLGVGSYDAYADPRRAFVTGASADAGGITLAVEVETVERVMRDRDIVRRKLREAVAAYGRRAIPDCRFVVVDDAGKVALAGAGSYREDGAIVLDLGGKLPAGRYAVSVGLYPNGNTVDADIKRIPYEAPAR